MPQPHAAGRLMSDAVMLECLRDPDKASDFLAQIRKEQKTSLDLERKAADRLSGAQVLEGKNQKEAARLEDLQATLEQKRRVLERDWESFHQQQASHAGKTDELNKRDQALARREEEFERRVTVVRGEIKRLAEVL